MSRDWWKAKASMCIIQMEYHSAFKKQKILPYLTKCMIPESAVLRRASQSLRNKYCILPFGWGIYSGQEERREENGNCQWLDGGADEELLLSGHNMSVIQGHARRSIAHKDPTATHPRTYSTGDVLPAVHSVNIVSKFAKRNLWFCFVCLQKIEKENKRGKDFLVCSLLLW